MDIRAQRLAAGLSESELAEAPRVPQPNLSAYENNLRTPSPEELARISHGLLGRPSQRVAERRDQILDVVAAHHARSPRLIGSIARGEDQPGSDVDLLVDFTDEATLLDEVGLRLALTDLLHVEVDVVASDSLRGDMLQRVLQEAVAV